MNGAQDDADRGDASLRPYTPEQIELLDSVWGSSLDDIYVYDAEGRYRYVNASAASHLGLERDSMLGRTWQELGLPAEATASFEAIRLDVLERGIAKVSTTVYPTTEGARAFEYTVSPLISDEGSVCGTLSVVRDATERLVTEEALADTEARYRMLFETMRQGVVYQNPDFEIEDANDAAVRILGLTRDSVTGRTSMDPIWQAIHEDGSDFPGDQHPAVLALKSGSPVFNVPMGIKTPAFSDYHWLRVTAVPLFKPGSDEPHQVVTIFEDVTSARRARDELERRVAERTADLEAVRVRLEHELAQRTLAEGEMLRTNRLLRMLSSCNQVLVHALDENDLLEQVTRALSDAGGYAIVAVIAEKKPESDRPFVVRAHSVSEHSGALRRWIARKDVVARVAEVVAGGRPDVWRGVAGALAERATCTVITVPMRADDVLTGALLIATCQDPPPEAEELALMVELAGDLEYGLVALHTRRLRESAEERLLESLHRVETAMRNSVLAMARMAEARDPYTAGHQARVAELARAIAVEMGYSAQAADIVWLAAVVHDIGKVSIPAEILTKPGALTELEFSLVRGHPEAADHIMREIDFPWPIAETVLQHHERMDGSGYPRGLSGDEILPDARILMVADVVEAISSHRPYRESLGVDHALRVIAEGRGTLFDAVVVDTCTELFVSRGFEFAESGALSETAPRSVR